MPAYIIVDVNIKEPGEYEEYKKLTPASIAAYGGIFIVRGGAAETLEGDWIPDRIVVLEFPNAERARLWWNSQEYAPAKLVRQRTASTEMILVEGVSREQLL
jgi:uncharacterized protein (DUF1330 family)